MCYHTRALIENLFVFMSGGLVTFFLSFFCNKEASVSIYLLVLSSADTSYNRDDLGERLGLALVEVDFLCCNTLADLSEI